MLIYHFAGENRYFVPKILWRSLELEEFLI